MKTARNGFYFSGRVVGWNGELDGRVYVCWGVGTKVKGEKDECDDGMDVEMDFCSFEMCSRWVVVLKYGHSVYSSLPESPRYSGTLEKEVYAKSCDY